MTDTSKTGWGAVCNGHAAAGLWTGLRLHWHINCLELLAILLTLQRFRPLIQGKHVLVQTDNTTMVAYVNRQGGLRSRCMSQLTRRLLLWSQQHLKSLQATHIPGNLNTTVAAPSQQVTHRGEWRLHLQVVQLIWSRFDRHRCTCSPPKNPPHCPLWYALTEASLGIDALAHSWSPGIRKYAFPPVSLLAQTLCKVREDEEHVILVSTLLARPDMVLGPHAPRDSSPLANSPEEGPSFSGKGHHPAPTPRPLESPCLAPGRDAEDLSCLPPAMVDTFTQARAPSTRRLYALKWRLFTKWCSSRREDPQRCADRSVLSFLQERLEGRLSPSSLKVYVAAIAAQHDTVDGKSLGKHDLIIRFLRGARRLNLSRPCLVPSSDLCSSSGSTESPL
ncbi:uncharacterized protein LOC127425963 [Myxocyprinus asiaticus]|uniref:uncharacterized protein LOC127425963 n=1 Tax=Myxocyprinus asiaticus TaxID=70543 RepID=UPI002221DA74|nr:uncharacterized protein LOC127425963 [Myxocyprinus asiaticus]